MADRNPWSAHVNTDYFGRGVKIAVMCENGDGTRTVYNFGGLTLTNYVIAEVGSELVPEVNPWLEIDREGARAMYEALARYFDGLPETVGLRKDYDAERARVDRLIGAVIDRNSRDAEGDES